MNLLYTVFGDMVFGVMSLIVAACIYIGGNIIAWQGSNDDAPFTLGFAYFAALPFLILGIGILKG